AVVAPPDAAAATAVARRAGMPRRLLAILEGESLFNDATALVLLRVAAAGIAAGALSPSGAVLTFVYAGAVGAAIGGAAGILITWLRRRRVPTLIETGLSLVTPFGVYLAAEEAHTSGVIAVVVTGLLLAHRSPTEQAPQARLTDVAMWSTVQLLVEGGVFMLIGLELTSIVASVRQPLPVVVVVTVVVVLIVVLIRPAWVFAMTYLARVVPWSSRGRPSAGGLAVISWAGMRGVVTLAAVQTIPLEVPYRDLYLLIAVVVILVTLGLQGGTLPKLVRRLDVRPPDPRYDALQVARAQQQAAEAAKERLRAIGTAEDLPEQLVERLSRQLELRANYAWEQLGEQETETPGRLYARLRREMVAAEREVIVRLRDSGELEEELLRDLQRHLDLEDALLPEVSEPEEGAGHQDVMPVRSAPACEHLRESPTTVPDADPRECRECLAQGNTAWVHLRACLRCGNIGCCDSSPYRHAEAHFESTGHPVVGSAEHGEQWRWCYKDKRVG
ncbi:MAG: cation:proton antiporter, partial [Streptosporangiales bacterium]